MKKITLLFTMLLLVAFSWQGNAQFSENFEGGVPGNFTETINQGAGSWGDCVGTLGGQTCPISGSTSASFYVGSYDLDNTSLTTPSMDLSAGGYILTFDHSQAEWAGDQSTLLVEISTDGGIAYSTVMDFTGDIPSVTSESFLLDTYTTTATTLIRFTATDSWGYSVILDNVVVTTAPSCANPSALASAPSSTTETTISWTAVGSESDWTYEYGAIGYAQGTETPVPTMSTSAMLSGLIAGNSYDFYVQANCGGTDGDSGWEGPFTWTQPNIGESCVAPLSLTVEADCLTATPYTLDYATATDIGFPSTCDAFGVNTGAWFEFTAPASGGVTLNFTDTNEYAIFDTCGAAEFVCNGTATNSAEIVGLTSGVVYKLAVWKDSATTGTTDICVEEFTPPPAPECAETPITPVDGATNVVVIGGAVDITWTTPAAGVSPTGYDILFGTTSGALPNIGSTDAITFTANITGIAFSTTYYWSIVPTNGATPAIGCAEWSFTTEAAPPPPANDTAVGATPLTPSPQGTGCTGFTFSNSIGGDGTTDSGLDGTCNTTDTGLDRFYTWTATTLGLIWNDGDGNPGIVIREAIAPYNEITCEGTFAGADIQLSGWTMGQNLIIQIYDFGLADVDTSFCLELYTAPTCLEPATLASANITENSADLTWAQGGTETDWEYVLLLATDPAPTTPGTATMAMSYNATSLASETDYVFYVRSDCGGGDFSPWASTAFSTTGPPPANDDCAGAIAIVPSTTGAEVWTTGTTLYNTASGEVADTDISCTSSFAFGSGRDVWFTTEVPLAGNITITTQASGGSPLSDTIMSVWSGTCGALTTTEIGCDDDGGAGAFSEVALTGLTPGDILYIRVQEYGAAASKGPQDGVFEIATHDPNPVLSIDDNVIDGFAIYPNPVNDMLRFNAQDDIESISIYNLLGQEVLRTQPRVSNTEVNMSNLPTGMYIVKVQVGEQLGSYRIIKE